MGELSLWPLLHAAARFIYRRHVKHVVFTDAAAFPLLFLLPETKGEIIFVSQTAFSWATLRVMSWPTVSLPGSKSFTCPTPPADFPIWPCDMTQWFLDSKSNYTLAAAPRWAYGGCVTARNNTGGRLLSVFHSGEDSKYNGPAAINRSSPRTALMELTNIFKLCSGTC